MHFSSSAAVLLASAALVSAHGRLQDPAPASAKFAQIGSNCGAGGATAGALSAASASLAPGQSATMQWFILNGDGAGPLQVAFDTTGAGTSFTSTADITTQVPGNNKIAVAGTTGAAHPLTFTVPADLTCPPTGCMMMVRQAGTKGFGSCALVSLSTTGASVVPTAPAAAATAAKGKKGKKAGGAAAGGAAGAGKAAKAKGAKAAGAKAAKAGKAGKAAKAGKAGKAAKTKAAAAATDAGDAGTATGTDAGAADTTTGAGTTDSGAAASVPTSTTAADSAATTATTSTDSTDATTSGADGGANPDDADSDAANTGDSDFQ
ncbi:hypothetical protein HKX48_008670 [Thoreauomyces humboldtii]|nr:hypothetical protein HKX48_008670 [Thoreauomyces humboldtii]